jgi:non-ribosomal peptide synthetase component F
LLRLLLDADPVALRGLRLAISGGEALPPDLARDWQDRLPGVPLWNLYGPTEATVYATWHRCGAEMGDHVPIGRPMANVQAAVLDESLRPVGPDQLGELCLMGAGLAGGYLRRQGQTEAAFVQHPTLGRLYRTGDRARLDRQGRILCLGRLDHQIKLNGYRIEPGEVEARLIAAGAAEAVVTRHRTERPPRERRWRLGCRAAGVVDCRPSTGCGSGSAWTTSSLPTR